MGSDEQPCLLRTELGDDAVKWAERGVQRRHEVHLRGERERPSCPSAHQLVEYLLEQGELVTSAKAKRDQDRAQQLGRSEGEHIQQMLDMERKRGHENAVILARVRALVNHKRKTLSMDDLKAALDFHSQRSGQTETRAPKVETVDPSATLL
jgi:hypothetical protein